MSKMMIEDYQDEKNFLIDSLSVLSIRNVEDIYP
jgi:hypothetical protein